jgi:hypothetical protein
MPQESWDEVEVLAAALEEIDHSRLPSWMVARIAAREYGIHVVRPLKEENARLRAELARLQESLGARHLRGSLA